MINKLFYWPTGGQRRRLIAFQTGDRIHHPRHGIGRVVGIVRRRFGGSEPARFAQLRFSRDSLTLMVREDDLAGPFRRPLDASGARRVLGHLSRCRTRLSRRWKARAQANEARLRSGDPFECAAVVTGLLKLQQSGANFGVVDRAQLKLATELLAEELGPALGATPEAAVDMIASRVGAGTTLRPVS